MRRSISTSNLTGTDLDLAVARCEGYRAEIYKNGDIWLRSSNGFSHPGYINGLGYSSNWQLGGDIIARKGISVILHRRASPGRYRDQRDEANWIAHIDGAFQQTGPTALISAMRTYVQSTFGCMIQLHELATESRQVLHP